MTVRSPGNSAAWIIPFWNDVYPSQEACLAAFPSVRAIIDQNADPAVQAASATSCMSVGTVGYEYQIAENELTVSKWVDFNTVDRDGKNRHHLWDAAQSSRVWPKYGSVNRNTRAPKGSATTSHLPNGRTSHTTLPTSHAPHGWRTRSTTANWSRRRPPP